MYYICIMKFNHKIFKTVICTIVWLIRFLKTRLCRQEDKFKPARLGVSCACFSTWATRKISYQRSVTVCPDSLPEAFSWFTLLHVTIKTKVTTHIKFLMIFVVEQQKKILSGVNNTTSLLIPFYCCYSTNILYLLNHA